MTTSPGNAVRFMEAFPTSTSSTSPVRSPCPTLVLHARRDAGSPSRRAAELAALIPGSRFVPLESPQPPPARRRAGVAALHRRGEGVPGRARLNRLHRTVRHSRLGDLDQHPAPCRARSARASARPADGDIGFTALSAAAASSSTSGRHRANRLTSTARWEAPKRPASNAGRSVDANVWASAPRRSASSGGTARRGTDSTASASTRADVRGANSGTWLGHPLAERSGGDRGAGRAGVASVRCRGEGASTSTSGGKPQPVGR